MKLNLPLNYLKEARQVILSAKDDFAKIDAERSQYPATYSEAIRLQGEQGGKAWLARKEMFEASEKKISLETKEKIANIREKYAEAVNQQITPNGEDLKSVDFELLNLDLVESEQALHNLVSRNDNYVFIKLAEKYAKKHQWSGFDCNIDVMAGIYLDYGKSYLDACDLASDNPLTSYHGMLLADNSEMGRRADAYGILDAYNDAGGDGNGE